MLGIYVYFKKGRDGYEEEKDNRTCEYYMVFLETSYVSCLSCFVLQK